MHYLDLTGNALFRFRMMAMVLTFIVYSHEMSLWDVGGQKTSQPFWENYFGKTNGVIWVIDSTDTIDRIHESCRLLSSLLHEDVGKF